MLRRTFVALGILWVAAVPRVQAVDITGRWEVSSLADFCLDIVQSGTVLTGTSCTSALNFDSDGTIDPITGVFTLLYPDDATYCPPPPDACISCGHVEINATAAP